MTGAQLRTLFAEAGLELDVSGDRFSKIAKHMGIASTTLKQNLKPSVEVPDSIERAVNDYLAGVNETARAKLRELHSAHLSHLVLSVFHEQLPNIAIQDFSVYPILLPERGHADVFPDHDAGIEGWSHFTNEFTGRLSRVYFNERTVLMGSPGSGKTTVMKRLLLDLEASHQQHFTPVFVSASIYDDMYVESLFHAVSLHYEKAWGGWTHELPVMALLQREAEAKRLVVFVDSLDEASAAQRRRLVSHIVECRAASIVSSRYCDPPIDMADRFTPHIFHLGGLSFQSVRSYLNTLIDSIRPKEWGPTQYGKDEEKPHGKDKEKLSSIQLLELLDDQFRFFADNSPGNTEPSTPDREQRTASREKALVAAIPDRLFDDNRFLLEETHPREQYPRHDDIMTDRARRAKECLTLLSIPIYLNLYISICLTRGVSTVAIDKLVDSYVEMLFGKWQRARSVYRRVLPDDDFDDNRMQDALAVIAFDSVVREHTLGELLTIADVRSTLRHHFRVNDFSTRTEVELEQDVQHVLEIARGTSGLLAVGGGGKVRFTAPHEMFSTYFASQYVSRAKGTVASAQFRDRRRAVPDHRVEFASYQRFLTNPNLRFLEDAVVIYLQDALGKKSGSSDFVLADLIQDALSAPSLNLQSSGCTHKELNEILPTNIIMLGRVFMSRGMKQRFGNLYRSVRDEIEHLYLNTNYEILFQAVSPLYFGLRNGSQALPRAESSNPTFEELDESWRVARSCNELLELAERVAKANVIGGGRSSDENRKIIVRRIAYMMRYFTPSFNMEAFKWLTARHQSYSKGEGKDSARQHLVFNSLRMIFDNMQEVSSKLYGKLQDWVWRHVNDEARSRDEFRAKMREFESTAGTSRSFLELVLKSPEIKIQELEMYPTEVARQLPRLSADYGDAVEFLLNSLKSKQEERRALQRSDRTEKDSAGQWERVLHDEARILRLMMYIANSFVGQQFFMPEEYSLERAGVFYPDTPYSRRVLLRSLFDGIKETQGGYSTDYAVGSWQLYDFYVQCVWTIARYLPSQSHYMYSS